MIDGFRKETLELCAPQKIIFGRFFFLQKNSVFWFNFSFCTIPCVLTFVILGHCTEFNVAGGVIQSHAAAECNKIFPKCDNVYNSTDAYKCK